MMLTLTLLNLTSTDRTAACHHVHRKIANLLLAKDGIDIDRDDFKLNAGQCPSGRVVVSFWIVII
jgi:hypothetical protein